MKGDFSILMKRTHSLPYSITDEKSFHWPRVASQPKLRA